MSTSFAPMYKFSNPFLVWIFLLLYISSIITYGFLVSVLFKSPSVAVNAGWLFFILTIILYNGIDANFGYYWHIVRIFLSLIVNVNMAVGIDLILYFEKYQEGVGFENLFERDVVMNFSFGELLICMFLGSVIQFLLTLYIERVIPGKFGIAEPWYFPVRFLIEFCWRKKIPKTPYFKKPKFEDFEAEPKNGKIGIEIRKIGKVAGNNFLVKDLSLNVYEGQITVLLGK